ncbi:MAG: ATP-binding protein [Coriobacteriaceae bacterium]|nr:ATP-binding protein [Coriobacteriaceae bacterium]
MEYKEEVTPSFLKTVSAYANYGMGRIVFGVTDDGEPIGVSNPIADSLRIENMINDSLDPVPRYTLEPNEATGVVTLTVYEGRDKPYRSKGKAYRRNDSATIEVDRLEYGRLVLEGSNLSFDKIAAAQQDLTFCELEHKLVDKVGVESLSSDIMRTLGLLGRDGYTNAAAILADSNDFPGIDMIRFGTTEDVILDRETVSGVSALKQIDEALEMHRRYYTYEMIEGSKRETCESIPIEAFREAVANALVHRTWDVRANVQIAMYDDRVVISSPGSLPPGLDEDRYLYGQISVLRNPVLAEVFLKLDYIERFGTGIARIMRSYRGSLRQPIFDVRGDVITVALPTSDAFEGSEGERSVLKALANGRVLSRSALEQETNMSRARTLAALEALMGSGMVLKTGSGRATKYRRA